MRLIVIINSYQSIIIQYYIFAEILCQFSNKQEQFILATKDSRSVKMLNVHCKEEAMTRATWAIYACSIPLNVVQSSYLWDLVRY
jgi:hypothetical protein